MRTIPRNHKAKIAQLKATLTNCKVYTLENYFHGKDVDPKYAWEQLDKFYAAKLTDNGNGKYTVHLHSNCWYELTAA